LTGPSPFDTVRLLKVGKTFSKKTDCPLVAPVVFLPTSHRATGRAFFEVIMDYSDFLTMKERRHVATGLTEIPPLHPALFDWQKEIVAWALRKGRACMFEDCGLGKTFQQLEWGRHVPGDVILFTPLAVSYQTEKEAQRFGIDAKVSRDGTRAAKITITNYEQMHRFDLSKYQGIILDESSILKSHDGKTRNTILEAAQEIPFRLACTATPAPNDHIELGNHAEFVGAMTRPEMLATFFVHDGGDTAKWRLKGHAVKTFWEWVATWAIMLRMPSDLGYADEGFTLPEMKIIEHKIQSGIKLEGELFVRPASTLNDQRKARRSTIEVRTEKAKEIASSKKGPWLVWCELNDEGDAVTAAIEGSTQIAGCDNDEDKASRMGAFSDGSIDVLVTKPKIAGFGMNWQHCHQMIFVGLSHSWEQFYQATRRCWRFGQKKAVEVHIIATDIESAILDNIKRKQEAADAMAKEMVENMKTVMNEEVRGIKRTVTTYERDTKTGDGWTMHLGDCIDVVQTMETDSIDYSVFSPPFASLYTYSASDRDMGNCSSHGSFFSHFGFLIPELLRVTKPGRLLSFHCMNLPLVKERDGVIGLTDFRGKLIQAFCDAGWIYHSEVVIWKDPVTAMQRTKALGLLYKQLKKDSCMSRQGIPDYLVTMRKPGINPDRVTKTEDGFRVGEWQEYASPVWMDINQSDTLQFRSAREDDDERHICPLQLDVSRRAIRLWTNPGDLVLSPFAGIGSEGFVALEMDRRYIGVELKKSYFKQACENLRQAKRQQSLFASGEK
jgi:superfamily II DNA or RNA helicase